MAAGEMRHRLRFEERATVDDGYGNTQSEFASEFIRWAQVKPSLGIETVNAARLAGQQPVDITVYRDSDTREIGADWRAVDINEGTVYAITAPPIDLKDSRKRLTMKAIVGVAA